MKIMYKKDHRSKIPYKDIKFQKILKFYLFECPVEGRSMRGSTFEDLGWKKARFSTLKAALLKNAHPSLRNNYYPCSKKELESKFEIVKSVSPIDEYCVFLKHDEKRVMHSLFSAIRNAFAHGSFSVRSYNGTKVYFFSNFKGYLKAEIVLQEGTLLNWIKAVNPKFSV